MEAHAKIPAQSGALGVAQAIEARRAVHRFLPGGGVAEAQWRRLFELTALTPSSYNFQPWEFIVVDRPEDKETLCGLCWNQRQVIDADAVIGVVGDRNPHRRDHATLQQFVDYGYFNDEVKQMLLNSIDTVYPDDSRRLEHAVAGASMAAMTLMLAAQEQGLVTAPLIGFDPLGVTRFLGVPEGYVVVMMLCVGRPAGPELPRQPRRPLADFVHHGRFGQHQLR